MGYNNSLRHVEESCNYGYEGLRDGLWKKRMHLHLAVEWRVVLVRHMPEKWKESFQAFCLTLLESVHLQNLEAAVLNFISY